MKILSTPTTKEWANECLFLCLSWYILVKLIFRQSCKWKVGFLKLLICISFVWNWTSLQVYISHLYIFLESETDAFLICPEGLLPGWQQFIRWYFKMHLNFRENQQNVQYYTIDKIGICSASFPIFLWLVLTDL